MPDMKPLSVPPAAFAGLSAAILFPSLSLFRRLPRFYPAAYLVLAVALLYVLIKFGYPWYFARVRKKHADRLALAIVVVLLAAFVLVYPKVDTGGFSLLSWQVGAADTDNGLQTAVGELVKGRYPYGRPIFSGQPISQLPGALLLAAPFYLLGAAPAQNVFWLLVFFLVARRLFGDGRPALFLLVLPLGLSPIFLVHVLTGVDLIANSLFVLTFSWLVIDAARRGAGGFKTGLYAVLLGIGLSSRINFILLTPLVFFALVKSSGTRKAVRTCALTGLSFLAVTLPFYLLNPPGFSPLYTLHTLRFQGFFANGHLLVPFLALALSFGLALRRDNSRTSVFLAGGALIQAVVVLGAVAASLLQAEAYYFSYAFYLSSYGVFASFFGLLAAGLRIFDPPPAAPSAI